MAYLPGSVFTANKKLKLLNMATTAIKITGPDGSVKRAKFMTVPQGIHCDVDVYACNEDFVPIGEPSIGVSEMDEPEYHIKLRKEADAKGQFVPEESTNPEWNPENQGNTGEVTKPEEHE